jgi:hypothetical protein
LSASWERTHTADNPKWINGTYFLFSKQTKGFRQKQAYTGKLHFEWSAKSYYDIIVTGKLSMFSISFQPHGAKIFFDVPSNEFFDQNVPLKYLVKDTIDELEKNIYSMW